MRKYMCMTREVAINVVPQPRGRPGSAARFVTLSSHLQCDVQNLMVGVAQDYDNLLIALGALKLNSDRVPPSLEVEHRHPLGHVANEHSINVDTRCTNVQP